MGGSQALVYDSTSSRSTIGAEVRELVRYRDLLWLLVLRNLNHRYKRSILGVGWTLLNPLITMLVMAFAFSHLLTGRVPNYLVYLLIGLTVWNFFAQSTADAMGTMVWGSGLMQKVRVPRTIFAVSCVANGCVNLVFALGPVLLIMVIVGAPFYPTLWFLPLGLAIVTVFVLGVSLLVSTLAVFFVDAVDTYRLAVQALFWLTPILYPEQIIPDQWRFVFRLNPMYYMIDLVRRPVYEGTLPDPGSLLWALALATVSLLAGAWYFTRKADEFQYHL
jgi:ABC-type polysaccharide/polyol phosphate export permease